VEQGIESREPKFRNKDGDWPREPKSLKVTAWHENFTAVQFCYLVYFGGTNFKIVKDWFSLLGNYFFSIYSKLRLVGILSFHVTSSFSKTKKYQTL